MHFHKLNIFIYNEYMHSINIFTGLYIICNSAGLCCTGLNKRCSSFCHLVFLMTFSIKARVYFRPIYDLCCWR